MVMHTLKIQIDRKPVVRKFTSGKSPVVKNGKGFVLKDSPNKKVVCKEKNFSDDFLKNSDDT